MNMAGKSGNFVDFFDIFPRTASGIWHPFVTVAPLGNPLKGQVILHEQQVMYPRLLTRHSHAKGNLCGVKGKNDLQPITENTCFYKDQGKGLEGRPKVIFDHYHEDKLISSSLQRLQHDL